MKKYFSIKEPGNPINIHLKKLKNANQMSIMWGLTEHQSRPRM